MVHAKGSASFQNIFFINFGVIMHYEFHFHEYCISCFSAVNETCPCETVATSF